MKASHRKDVIIARLIFAAICIFIIAGITAIIVTVTSKSAKKKETADNQSKVATSESETSDDTEIGTIYLPNTTTEQTEETVSYVTTTSSVNMREKPDKNATIITTIAPDVKLEYLSEDNGWTEVKFQDQTGYVSSDYVKSSLQDDTSGDDATDDDAANDGAADDSTTNNGTTGSSTKDSVTAGVSSALTSIRNRT